MYDLSVLRVKISNRLQVKYDRWKPNEQFLINLYQSFLNIMMRNEVTGAARLSQSDQVDEYSELTACRAKRKTILRLMNSKFHANDPTYGQDYSEATSVYGRVGTKITCFRHGNRLWKRNTTRKVAENSWDTFIAINHCSGCRTNEWIEFWCEHYLLLIFRIADFSCTILEDFE